jgi:hypothetical protein
MVSYLNLFNQTRRIKRDVNKLYEKYKGILGHPMPKDPDNPYGKQGEFFVGGEGTMEQKYDESVIDYNDPPDTQPGLWCQWQVTEDGRAIKWDGSEKSYNSTEWMEYIINNFIAPTGSVCNGVINAYGEDRDDVWDLVVTNNKVTIVNKFPSAIDKTINVLSKQVEKKTEVILDIVQLAEAYIDLLQPLADTNQSIPASKAIKFANAIKNKLKVNG